MPTDLATETAAANADVVNRRADFPFDASSEGRSYQTAAEVPPRPFDNDEYSRSLAPAAREAWSAAALGDFDDVWTVTLPNGMTLDFPKSGCLTEARIATFGSIESAAAFEAGLSSLQIETRLRADADERVMTAIQTWSQCVLEESGRDFDHFTQSRAYAAERPDEAGSVAAADATCTERSDLRSIYEEAVAFYAEEVTEENIGLIEEYSANISAAIDRAKSLLDE